MEERLQKLIASAGIASRRKAEEMILTGQVTVNGQIVTELGIKGTISKSRANLSTRGWRIKRISIFC
jgi:16S rRNA U516 pseudouridylate synthase RsuA-like enzyme